ncbi:tudor domain-containing protein 5 [Thalassophryne amazonica]|uniref:tudor domain-containing protein 5 n=1 Tax=Thalassophryne amazonica TaxID=390379 RepID=UPI001470BF50|nr:tudor domain-containing protein 5 [Thalassophryne amazonica]
MSASNMDQEEVMAKLKKDVRSLLISSKTGLAPDQLKRDYLAMLGHPLPFKILGFRNIKDMLMEMVDVVAVDYLPDGSLVLKAIGDETTRGIENLVAKQRLPKSKVKKRQLSYFTPHSYHPPPTVVLPRRGGIPSALPAQLRTQLRILLAQGPLRLSDLEVSFQRFFGHPLRIHTYGFYSTGEMLQAASDLVHIHQGRMGSILSLRQQMVPRPLLVSPPKETRDMNPIQYKPKPFYKGPVGAQSQTPAVSSVPVKQTPPDVSIKHHSFELVHNNSSVLETKPEVDVKNQEAEPDPCQEGQLFKQRVIELEEALQQRILENGVAGTISQELKKKLQQVVCQTTDGLSVYDLPAEYKKFHGEELPLLQSGFVSITELVSAMSDIFHMKLATRHGDQHWIVNIKDTDRQTDPCKSEPTAENTERPSVSYYFHCGGSLWEDKREAENIKADEKNQEMQEGVNYSMTPKMVKQLSEIYSSFQIHSSPSVPLDALQVQLLKPPTRRSVRQLVDVLVEKVHSPGHFYIRFSESKEARAMEDMMIEMRRCYTCPGVSECYRLHKRFVRPGQVCCVSPKGMWFYRAVILQVISPTQVEVYYADFGDVGVVQSANLKFLKSCYSILPAQAVPSSLAEIKPVGGSWSAEATASFQKLCSDRTLVGALDCYTGDVLQLYLCDTHTDNDIYIHSVLQSEGHAMACSPKISAALCTHINPVSLYMGERLLELPPEEEETTPCLDSTVSLKESMNALKVEDEELPGLELINDNEISFHTEVKELNPFSALLSDQSLQSYDELAVSSNDQTLHTANTICGTYTFADVSQSRTNPPLYSIDTEALEQSSPLPPSSTDPTSEEQPPEVTTSFLVNRPSILTVFSNLTPEMIPTQVYPQGVTVSPLNIPKSAMVFPLRPGRSGLIHPPNPE